ncbi:MAG: hypothetical protein FJ100_11320 [Deltaproteobacteria bacterium]|nr:hypothetical protein [Deltaproteobacteria bacterium]
MGRRWLSVAVFVAACGTTPVPSTTATDAADATAGDAAVVDTAAEVLNADTVAADAAVQVDAWQPTADVTPAKRNPACGAFDDSKRGKKQGWAGYTVGKQVFTCNVCRGGDPLLQGNWRQIDFKTEDPATPMGDDKELLVVDGNVWHDRIAGKDKDGKVQEQVLDGWYFCSDAAEWPSKDQFWIVEQAVPEGLFGNKKGHVLRLEALTNGKDLLALTIYDAIDSKTTKTYNYCRVGSTIKGSACKDPFAP